jgi:hypothetical protein
MNIVNISGWVQGPPEIRVTKDGRRILNFQIAVDGPGENEPYAPIGYILAEGENPGLKPGEKIFAIGPLRHHRTRGLFVAATKIDTLDRPHETQRAGPDDSYIERNWTKYIGVPATRK